jgi:peptide deformylase
LTTMIRPILKYPAPELEIKSRPVDDFNGELRTLVDDMLETMYVAPGVGLAAPQVGVDLRVLVADPTGGAERREPIVLVNPEITESSGRQREEEGCLSLPNLTAVVERPFWVAVRGYDAEGNQVEIEGEELVARILCHEIDHLDGILYLDRISALKRDLLKRKIRKLIRAGEW